MSAGGVDRARRRSCATPIEIVTGMRAFSNLNSVFSTIWRIFSANGRRAGAVDLGQHDRELLAAVAREAVLAPDLRACTVWREVLEHVVAGQVAVAVVDLLEVVDVEHHQRQRPPVAVRARDLALERLEEVALVEDLRQAVDGRQAVDLLVVGVLDVAAGQELEDRAADLDEIAVAQDVLVDRLVVDVGAVGRAEIADQDRLAGVDDLRVIARDRFLIDLDVALRRSADHQRRRVEVVLLAQLGAVDHDQAGLLARRLLGDAADAGDDRLRPDVVRFRGVVGIAGMCAPRGPAEAG